jgi:hypothetical protein
MLGITDHPPQDLIKPGLAAIFISSQYGSREAGRDLYRARPFLLPIFGELAWTDAISTPAPAVVLLRRFGFSPKTKTIRRMNNGL